MTDKKLTDSEIVKALKTLLELVLVEGCLQRAKTISNVLDLINRLQARKEHYQKMNARNLDNVLYLSKQCDELQEENENYSKNNQQMTSDILKLYKELEQVKAENERLKETTKNMSAYVKGNNWGLVSFVEFCKNLKAEAYKEFAERLKERYTSVWTWDGHEEAILVLHTNLDNLLKELVGEDK